MSRSGVRNGRGVMDLTGVLCLWEAKGARLFIGLGDGAGEWHSKSIANNKV